jgi:8-oxo-dGTP pyrophosphatase MutT (NUDIX family)
MSFLSTAEALLRDYAPRDPREAAYRKRMLDLARRPRALARDHFDPGHFTVSAFVLSPERDGILLIFHKKLARWLQPGGHVEEQDGRPCDTARREVLEEVGIADLSLVPSVESVFDIDIHPIPPRPSEPGHEHFDLRFLFVAKSRKFARTDEVADAKWVSLADLPTITGDESVLRAVRKVRDDASPRPTLRE